MSWAACSPARPRRPSCWPTAQGAGVIFASTRQRAQETAPPSPPGARSSSDALFIEAPLPPPHFPSWFKLPPKYWGGVCPLLVARLQPSRRARRPATRPRPAPTQAARTLIARAETGEDVLVLAHGYFNHMVGRRLKAEGWKLVHNQGFKYWSQRRYERA